MIKKVSKILAARIKEFMQKILSEDIHCVDDHHKHEDVRETSLLFKEINFGMKTWTVEVPTTGIQTFMPFFAFKTNMIKQPWEQLERSPKPDDIYRFFQVIMNAF